MKKRIAYSLLLIFALSCGSQDQQQNHVITIEMRNSPVQDYSLLAVRKEGVVVRSESSSYVESKPKFIAFSKIEKMYQTTNTGAGGALRGTLMGLLPGAGMLFAGKQRGDINLGGTGILLMPIGAVAGGIIGCNSSKSKNDFNPSSENSRQKLTSISLYPNGEPAELEKIK